jgi:gamma-glutamyltranspeptidase / glutathione hydrolase
MHNVVATSQRLAVQAGLHALRSGGNAVDAALATAITLSVVEPVSNGVGGDLFAIVWDGKQLHGLNASGCAPAASSLKDYQGLKNVPLTGTHTIAVPGAPAGWQALSAKLGKLPFANLFDAAIDYAQHGFLVSPVVSAKWAREAQRLKNEPGFAQLFASSGETPKSGAIFKNPALAKSLKAIAISQSQDFYQGDLGRKLMQSLNHFGCPISMADLAANEVLWQKPLSVNYRGKEIWQLPPNGQGLAALLAMGVLGEFERGNDEAQWLHLQAECIKLSFAKMYPYLSDISSLSCDPQHWITPDHIKAMAQEISIDRAATYGDATPPWGGTVYVTAADSSGCMVSLIQSTFFGFGSGVVCPHTGIHLNNRLSCFSLDPTHPNVLAGGKRPMNTIIPGFVTQAGLPLYALGVTGGPIQPQGQMQLLTRMIDDGLSPQEAVQAKRWKIEHARGSVQLDLEAGFDPQLSQTLRARGHREDLPGITGLDFGGAYAIERQQNAQGQPVYLAGNDPRRDGAAEGF